MPKKSVLGLTYTYNALKRHGYDVSDVMQHHGFDMENLDPSALIDQAKEVSILTDLLSTVNDPGFGIECGKEFTLAGYGSYGMLLMSSSSPFEAVQTGIQYQPLTFLLGKLFWEPEEEFSSLCYQPFYLPASIERFIVDRDLSGTFRLMEDLENMLNLSLMLVDISIAIPEPDNAASYHKRYGCPIHFNAPVTKIRTRNAYLTQKFPSSNPAVYAMHKKLCDEMINQRKVTQQNLSDSVIGHLNLFHKQFPTSEQVALSLGISERSLRRKLQHDGTTFQRLLDNVRYEKAQSYLLNTNSSIEQIAEHLDYSEAASFIRAFQRWAGVTPAKFRRTQRSE